MGTILLSICSVLLLCIFLILIFTVLRKNKILKIELKKINRTLDANDKLKHLTDEGKDQLLLKYQKMETAFDNLEKAKKEEKTDNQINREYHFQSFYLNGLVMSERNTYGDTRLSLSKKGVDLIDSFTDINSIVNYAMSLIDTFPFIKPEANKIEDYSGMVWKSPLMIHRFMLSKLFLRLRYLVEGAEEFEETAEETAKNEIREDIKDTNTL